MDDFGSRTGAAVVTGGSGGIGAAICRLLAERGSNVALTYHRNADAAAGVVADIEHHRRRGRAWALDMVDTAATATFLSDVVAEFGGIHTLVHTAGPHVPQIHLSRVEPGRFREQIEAEVVAFFNIVQPRVAPPARHPRQPDRRDDRGDTPLSRP